MFMTVCIPTYNRAYIIENAIGSVLNQTYQEFELIIVDDGSNDNTYEIIERYLDDYRIKYVYKNNGGKHTALNLGIKLAQGEFFMILDSDDALEKRCIERMKEVYFQSSNDGKCCGVMGKCMELENGLKVGDNFDIGIDGYEKLSYIDIHFRNKKKYGDCCECVKTSILKQYQWPEDNKIKFIPESYVFDKIGVKYYLLCVNDVFKYVEYQDDGITKNKDFHKNNYLGFLYNYVDKIDNIFNVCHIPLKKKISIWRLYWNAVKMDNDKQGIRVKKNKFLGYFTYLILPVLNKLKG